MKKELIAFLSVDFASPVPVYEQIKKLIKHAIARRMMNPGEALPSIRELASFLKINPNTVARAYRDLAQEKIIDGRAGIGFWIEEGGGIEPDKTALLKEEFQALVEKAVEMGYSRADLKGIILEFFEEKK